VADDAVKVIWLLHGVNLDMLGHRDPEHYGTLTLAELCRAVTAHARERGADVRCFQTNHEGRMVGQLHALARGDELADGVVFNPGAWTHYSWAIHDALELLAVPVAEVHLSDVGRREPWRQVSVLADLAAVTVSGKGLDGYLEAVDALLEMIRGE
jgi:3-dehydroquinate dehydratase II